MWNIIPIWARVGCLLQRQRTSENQEFQECIGPCSLGRQKMKELGECMDGACPFFDRRLLYQGVISFGSKTWFDAINHTPVLTLRSVVHDEQKLHIKLCAMMFVFCIDLLYMMSKVCI